MPSPSSVPESEKPQFKKIVEMEDHLWNDFISLLLQTTPCADAKYFAAVATSKLAPELSDASSLVRTAISLHALPDRTDFSKEEIAHNLSQSYSEEEDVEIDVRKLERRLLELLNVQSIQLTLKASEIILSNNKTFLEARVITDVRPVFLDEDTMTPAGAVFVHNLRITYGEGQDRKEFFVVLDTRDIDALKSVIDRVEEKEASVRRSVNTLNVPIFEVCEPLEGDL